MKYFGLFIIFMFFVVGGIAFLLDIQIGIGHRIDARYDTKEKCKKALIRGVIGMCIEFLLIIYFAVLIIYYALH